jgi:hypothetical protein
VNKKELLLEGINSAAQTLAKAANVDIQELKTTSNVRDTSLFWEDIVDLDPTPKKKYLDWIVKYYITLVNVEIGSRKEMEFKPVNFLELLRKKMYTFSVSGMYDYQLKLFRDFYKFTEDKIIIGEQADINSYSNTAEIEKVVLEAKRHKQKRIIRKYAKKDADIRDDAELVLSTDSYYIVRPETRDASVFYGKGTSWCISGEENQYFNKYRAVDLLNIYMIIVTSSELLTELLEVYEEENDEEHTKLLTKKLSKIAILVKLDGTIDSYWHGKNYQFVDGIGIEPYFEHLQIDTGIFKGLTGDQFEEAKEQYCKHISKS